VAVAAIMSLIDCDITAKTGIRGIGGSTDTHEGDAGFSSSVSVC
jgi:hypothetical protein